MKPTVFVRHGSGPAVSWTRTSVRELWRRTRQGQESPAGEESAAGGEKYLEDLIVERPELLGLENDDEETPVHGPFRCFPQRTVKAVNGRLIYPDILILAESGDVIVVEVKLGDNQELKDRRVIGQVLEYAASLTGCEERQLLEMFDGEARGARTWSELVRALFPESRDPARLANQFAGKFRAADLHLVIACDEVPPGLAELVRGVVDQKALGGFQLRVVEIAPFANEAQDELLFLPATRVRTEIVQRISVQVVAEKEQPSVSVSVTTLAAAEKQMREAQERAGGRSWDEASFFADVRDRVDEQTAAALRLLYEACAKKGFRIAWGKGAKTGAFHVLVDELSPKNVIAADSAGVLWVSFGNLSSEQQNQLRSKLQSVGLAPADSPYPGLRPEVWRGHASEIASILDELRREQPPRR
jgi:hypothetical protein